MKAVLLSLHPEWWDLILAGRKTVEIRKTAPSNCEWPVRVLVYLTAPVSAVVGEFLCFGYQKTNRYRQFHPRSCVSLSDLYKYGKGKEICGWDIASPMLYPQKKTLTQLGIRRPPQSWQYCEVLE